MKKADLLARIDALETRIASLEARPYFYPTYVPQSPTVAQRAPCSTTEPIVSVTTPMPTCSPRGH